MKKEGIFIKIRPRPVHSNFLGQVNSSRSQPLKSTLDIFPRRFLATSAEWRCVKQALTIDKGRQYFLTRAADSFARGPIGIRPGSNGRIRQMSFRRNQELIDLCQAAEPHLE